MQCWQPARLLSINKVHLVSRLRVAAKAEVINQSSPELVRCHAKLWRNNFQKTSTSHAQLHFHFQDCFREKQKIIRLSRVEFIFMRAAILENQEI